MRQKLFMWRWNLTKPPVWAIRIYRLAHWLWGRGWVYIPFVLCAVGRILSGVEIFPSALIGKHLTIIHGVGVVIGDSAEIGDDCYLLHGVTLGQLDPLAYSEPGTFSQPRLGNRVVVGANAVLLGPITIGDGARIGAGAVVLQDVPAGWTAVGNPARLLPPKAERESAAAKDGVQPTR